MAGFGSGHLGGKKSTSVARFSHGGYSYLRTANVPPCRVCVIGQKGGCPKYRPEAESCEIALEAQDEMISKIVKLPWIKPEDMPLIELYVRDWTFIFILDKWLSIVGPFRTDEKEGLSTKGVLKMRWVAENSLARLANQLGLSPEARKTLGLSLAEEPDLVRLSSIEERFRTKPAGNAAGGNGKEGHDSEREA